MEKDVVNVLAIDIQSDYTEIEGIMIDGGAAGGSNVLIKSTTGAQFYKILNNILQLDIKNLYVSKIII